MKDESPKPTLQEMILLQKLLNAEPLIGIIKAYGKEAGAEEALDKLFLWDKKLKAWLQEELNRLHLAIQAMTRSDTGMSPLEEIRQTLWELDARLQRLEEDQR